jgi:hypothetical protein
MAAFDARACNIPEALAGGIDARAGAFDPLAAPD